MKVICEITDYIDSELGSDKSVVKIHSTLFDGDMVEIEFDKVKCKVSAKELVAAVQRATLDCFGR